MSTTKTNTELTDIGNEALQAAYDTLVFYANMGSYNNGAAELIANTADGVPAYKITPAPIMLDDGQKARSQLPLIREALASCMRKPASAPEVSDDR